MEISLAATPNFYLSKTSLIDPSSTWPGSASSISRLLSSIQLLFRPGSVHQSSF